MSRKSALRRARPRHRTRAGGPWRTRLRRLARHGLLSPGWRDLLEVAAVIGVGIGLAAFILDMWDREADREVRRETLASMAWETLARNRPPCDKSEGKQDKAEDCPRSRAGDRGQIQAVQYLARTELAPPEPPGLLERLRDALGAQDMSPEPDSPTGRLSGADLSHQWLNRIDLRGAGLSQVNLTDATLIGANLIGATLTDANLFRATLTDAKLLRATLTGADLSDATLIDADLTDADLTDATLAGVDLSDAILNDATLTDAILAGATLTNADLIGASLSGATLIGTTLTDATLLGAEVSGAIVSRQGMPPLLISATLSIAQIETLVTDGPLSWGQLAGLCLAPVPLFTQYPDLDLADQLDLNAKRILPNVCPSYHAPD